MRGLNLPLDRERHNLVDRAPNAFFLNVIQ